MRVYARPDFCVLLSARVHRLGRGFRFFWNSLFPRPDPEAEENLSGSHSVVMFWRMLLSSKHVPNMQTCSCFSLIVVSLHSVLCNPCTCLEVSPMDVLIPSVARRWGFDHFHLLTSKGGASLNTVRSPGAAAGPTAGHTGKYIFSFKKSARIFRCVKLPRPVLGPKPSGCVLCTEWINMASCQERGYISSLRMSFLTCTASFPYFLRLLQHPNIHPHDWTWRFLSILWIALLFFC